MVGKTFCKNPVEVVKVKSYLKASDIQWLYVKLGSKLVHKLIIW